MTNRKPKLNGTNGHAKASKWADYQQRKAKALEVIEPRPQTRADCADGERPCPWVSCRHHLLTDRLPKLTDEEALDELDAMPETCVLDVADQGGVSHQSAADALGMSELGVIIAERRAMAKIRDDYDADDFDDFERG